jgi:chromosome segregation ATPase
MTVQSSIILRLLDRVPDVLLREQIKAQYYQDMEAQTSFVQVRIGQLEIDLRDQLQQSLGDTNQMISESVHLAREGGVALRELRNDFQSWLETVTSIADDVLLMKRRIDDHDRDIASFRQSRDQSIAERLEFRIDLQDSKKDRESIHTELSIARDERARIATQLNRIEAMLLGRPSNEEAAQLVKIIHETKHRLDRLDPDAAE